MAEVDSRRVARFRVDLPAGQNLVARDWNWPGREFATDSVSKGEPELESAHFLKSTVFVVVAEPVAQEP